MATYAHDENNNRIETLSKEEIYALLAEAIQEGQLPSVDTPTAFVTMIKSIVDGKPYKQAYCTQAQYNEMLAAGTLEADTMYYIIDDDSYNELVNAINLINQAINSINQSIETTNQKIDDLKIYHHFIRIANENTGSEGEIYINIYNLDNTAYTFDTLPIGTYAASGRITDNSNRYHIETAHYIKRDEAAVWFDFNVVNQSFIPSTVGAIMFRIEFGQSIFFTDTVTQM